MRSSILISCALTSGVLSAAEPTGHTHEYRIGETTYEGYIARPAQPDTQVPGVLVVHDWTGNGEFSRGKADALARLGYIAFAVDLYGKGRRAKNPGEARQLSGELYGHPELFRQRMQAALEELRKQPGVDPERLGAIGFCFGGTAVLELVRSGADLAGAVTFHGGLKPLGLPSPREIKPRLLILHGTWDPNVPPADVAACMAELNAAHALYRFVGYPGAVHAFTNPAAGDDPARGAAYNAAADQASFAEMEAFFRDVFKK